MHVDETSLRVDRKNHWIHVCPAGHITYKFLHPKRGLAAIEASGVIPRYGGVIIHDCWASYLSYDQCGHGLCGSPCCASSPSSSTPMTMPGRPI
ncbi:IS66 family transposase [Thiolapillus sp.]|uniref:IS66 family transposase n=1 Tax=Thiolapillus sp. TaxID=2017437 RepID=UPI003AF6F50A